MKQKTALITGASRGIGRSAALAFAGEGYDLVLNCKTSISELEDFASELEKDFSVRTLRCCGDVGSYDFVRRMFDEAAAFCGGVDVLVNNAGISYIGLLSEMPCGEWERMIRTNLSSVFFCCKCAIPHMVSQKSGKIINLSSAWGSVGASCEAAYSASKGGVHALTRALAKELAPSNIQVNAVACGVIDTDMNACLDIEEREALRQEIPANRFGEPDEVGRFLLQLAQAPPYLTGQVIGFDGGWI